MVVTSYHNTAASNMLTDAMTGFEMNEGMLDDNTGTFGLGYDGARAKRKMVEGGGGKSRTGRSNTGRSAKASKSAKSKKKESSSDDSSNDDDSGDDDNEDDNDGSVHSSVSERSVKTKDNSSSSSHYSPPPTPK